MSPSSGFRHKSDTTPSVVVVVVIVVVVVVIDSSSVSAKDPFFLHLILNKNHSQEKGH